MGPDAFISRWQGRDGGQERANYALFLSELCVALDLPPPDPAGERTENNAYVFERAITFGETADKQRGRIDLYKRGCFVLEAKQSRWKGQAKEVELADAGKELFGHELRLGRRATGAAAARWDTLMLNARRQAEDYARALPAEEGWPPFIITCDVGHALEVFADFSGQGKNYTQFPDRKGFRIYLDDLRDPKIRDRLKAIWSDPMSIDPARVSARATREIANRLAVVSKRLEQRGVAAEDAAMFLMRCLFTMFAEDAGLLTKDSFKKLLARCVEKPETFQRLVGQLWEAMDKGGFAYALEEDVRRFNGSFFKSSAALDLGREEIGELLEAAKADWREVEPAIFGTLLEQALSPKERAKLGAHYTPRAYVERLVVATMIGPLREEWDAVLGAAEQLRADGKRAEAARVTSEFHERLCAVRVLDPACGTGNFLYVALEMMKRLEDEVLEALAELGGAEGLAKEDRSVDPRQFIGMEINARARAIAELVLWIGYLQWHFRMHRSLPGEPILKAFGNIRVFDAVLKAETDAAGQMIHRVGADGELTPIYDFANPQRPDWPEAEFIVGNPPFIGGKDVRARLGDAYATALWAAHPQMNESADFVMYWWDRAAELLTRKGTVLRRFGFVTTNSISQVFQRRVVERHLTAKAPVSLIFAIPDHPWTKATKDSAAVRIAMTVAEAGSRDGRLHEVMREAALDDDQPVIELDAHEGRINGDLTVGIDVGHANALMANRAICSPGVKLHGAGFIVTPQEAALLGLGRHEGLARHIRPYRNGRDLTARPRDVMVIDLFELDESDVRRSYPEVYQHIVETVKPERDANNRATYRDNWWVFGEPRRELRPALLGLSRYIATVETAKHRVFQFLDGAILPDNMLVCMALDDGFELGVLSSRIHAVWTLAQGGTLEDRPRYTKSQCFDPFPFPDPPLLLRAEIAALAEELDTHRKRQQAAHPKLTLTQMYNVLEKLRAGAALDGKDEAIKRDGLVLILRELHDCIDAKVAAAYGWSAGLSEEETLARLVALNAVRSADERRGRVRWLRPDFQIPRLGKDTRAAHQTEADLPMATAKAKKPRFPTAAVAQTQAVIAVFAGTGDPLSADTLAARFSQGHAATPRIAKTLGALHRLGVIRSGDRGQTFTLTR